MRNANRHNVLSAGLFAVLLILGAAGSEARSSYLARIPNGNSFSCNTCHSQIPSRNPFGRDFKQNGRTWSASLAMMDSDGDGLTNGEELQDPLGTWTPGDPDPGSPTDVTNPGVPDVSPSRTPTPTNTPSPTHTLMPTPSVTSTLGGGPRQTPTATATAEPTESPTTHETTQPTRTRTPSTERTPTPTRTYHQGSCRTEIEGRITSLDPTRRTFVLRGILVVVTDSTRFEGEDDGRLDFEDLDVGDRVEVKGDYLDDGTFAACKIESEEEGHDDDDGGHDEAEIEGRITEIDPSQFSFVVNGTLILTDSRTRFEGHEHVPLDFDSLEVGNRVEVKGRRLDDGSLLARSVKLKDQGNEDEDECERELEGPITDVDPDERTMVIGMVRVRTSDSTRFREENHGILLSFDDFRIGDFVEVKYCESSGTPPLARRVERKRHHEDEDREIEIEGAITELDSLMAAIVVNSRYIRTTGADIRGEHGMRLTYEDLSTGDFVEVKGDLLEDGTVQASRIKRKSGSEGECETEIRGFITNIYPATSTVAVGYIEVFVDENTRMEDDTTGRRITFDDLRVGQSAEVKFCATPGVPVAVKIEIKHAGDFDLDGDGEVREGDLIEAYDHMRKGGITLDLDGDNRTTAKDLLLLTNQWKKRTK